MQTIEIIGLLPVSSCIGTAQVAYDSTCTSLCNMSLWCLELSRDEMGEMQYSTVVIQVSGTAVREYLLSSALPRHGVSYAGSVIAQVRAPSESPSPALHLHPPTPPRRHTTLFAMLPSSLVLTPLRAHPDVASKLHTERSSCRRANTIYNCQAASSLGA